MRINKIDNTSFKGIRIEAKENKEVKYLYNKVLDVVRQEKIPGVFANDYITLETKNLYPKTKKTLVDKLTEWAIKFTENNK